MIKDIFYNIKNFIQRGKRGWADCDAWNGNDYLAKIIIGMMRELAKDNTGCPHDLYDENVLNNECHKWNEVLEEIAQGFEAYEEMTNLRFYFLWEKKDGKITQEYKKEKGEQLLKKYERGMKLFSKYFMNLWD